MEIMKKFAYSIGIFLIYSTSIYSQQLPVKIEGEAQGTTYHITYYDEQNRDFQPEIEKILHDFDLSVSNSLF
jgi:thiamine biosynthesis lipoprotein